MIGFLGRPAQEDALELLRFPGREPSQDDTPSLATQGRARAWDNEDREGRHSCWNTLLGISLELELKVSHCTGGPSEHGIGCGPGPVKVVNGLDLACEQVPCFLAHSAEFVEAELNGVKRLRKSLAKM